MNLILCGLPKSGKTIVGKALSRVLKWPFIDTDRLIEEALQLSCREIFLVRGESHFRTIEKEQISSLKGLRTSVVAIGGGTLDDPENIACLESLGHIIYLEISVERLLERFAGEEIPPYLDADDVEGSLRKLAKRRIPVYEKAARCTIKTDGLCVDEIVSLISHGK